MGYSVSGDTLQYRLKESVLTHCEWRWAISSHLISTLNLWRCVVRLQSFAGCRSSY